jgi:hypothetical protein
MPQVNPQQVNPHFLNLLNTCLREGVPDTIAAYLYTYDPKDRLENGSFPPVKEPSLELLNQSISSYKATRMYSGRQS